MKTLNVITYARVSTDEQADSGFSLNHQKEMLNKYCDIKNHNVVMHYVEDYSAKNFERPEWFKLMAYVKKISIWLMLFCLQNGIDSQETLKVL
jgi:DNA invertase Pin-like site-specific DNA recombinase